MKCYHAKFLIITGFHANARYFASQLKILHPVPTLGYLAIAGGLGTELPHKQIFSLLSYFKNFLYEYLKGETFHVLLFVFVCGDVLLYK
jgi:hypothetical protein